MASPRISGQRIEVFDIDHCDHVKRRANEDPIAVSCYSNIVNWRPASFVEPERTQDGAVCSHIEVVQTGLSSDLYECFDFGPVPHRVRRCHFGDRDMLHNQGSSRPDRSDSTPPKVRALSVRDSPTD